MGILIRVLVDVSCFNGVIESTWEDAEDVADGVEGPGGGAGGSSGRVMEEEEEETRAVAVSVERGVVKAPESGSGSKGRKEEGVPGEEEEEGGGGGGGGVHEEEGYTGGSGR